MFRSFLLLHQCYYYSAVPLSFIKRVKSNLKLGLLITFHYHSILCHCQKTSFNNSAFIQMAELSCSSSKDIFVGNVDRYRGVHIRSVDEPCDSVTFASKLQASLSEWKSLKIQAAWFFISLEHADWVPVLAKNGFRFHHTKSDVVAMVRWMTAEPSRIPVFAHTIIGAGAVVVNDEGKLLVVQETFRGTPYWKLPGGYVEPGEDIPEAAMREVLEETNIKTEFRSVLAFRHAHGAPFGCSDIYFVVELAPLSTAITSDEVEIEDCQWMEIDTFLNHPNVHKNNRLLVRKYLYNKEKGLSISGTKTFHPVTNAPQMLYFLGPPE